MNKSELVAAVSAHTEVEKKHVASVLDGLEDVIVSTVHKGEKVALTGFLTFDKVHRKARTARNPRTGEAIQVAASHAPKVSVGAAFKNVVNGKAPAPKVKS